MKLFNCIIVYGSVPMIRHPKIRNNLIYWLLIIFGAAGCSGTAVITPDKIPDEVIAKSATGSDALKLKYVIRVREGNEIKYIRTVKYIGIKTPKDNEPFNKSAREFNESLLSKRKVRLEFDKYKLDPYGRLLAYVYAGEIFINAELIKRGYARAYIVEPNTKYAELFQRLENTAKEKRIGLWSLHEEPPEAVSQKQQQAAPEKVEYRYIASKSSKVFHLPSCRLGKRITEENRIYFNTFKEALDSGREPCKLCNPEEKP